MIVLIEITELCIMIAGIITDLHFPKAVLYEVMPLNNVSDIITLYSYIAHCLCAVHIDY